MNSTQKDRVLTAVANASEAWRTAFNAGDAAACAAQYENDAVMQAEPFGTFTGTQAISGFWQTLFDDGFSDVRYSDITIDVINETSAVLTANWTMNNAAGVINKELWVLQADGTARLRQDNFEALG